MMAFDPRRGGRGGSEEQNFHIVPSPPIRRDRPETLDVPDERQETHP